MKLFKPLITALLALLLVPDVMAQEVSTSGTNFSFVFLQNRLRPNGQKMNMIHPTIQQRIYVTNNEPSTSTVEIVPPNDYVSFSYYVSYSSYTEHNPMVDIPANETVVFDVIVTAPKIQIINPCGELEGTEMMDMRYSQLMNNLEYDEAQDFPGGVTNTEKVFKVISHTVNSTTSEKHEISVFAESTQTKSRDVSLILPQEALGNSYAAMTATPISSSSNINYPQDKTWGEKNGSTNVNYTDCNMSSATSTINSGLSAGAANHGGPAEIGILAIDDNTRVEVTYTGSTNPFTSVFDDNRFQITPGTTSNSIYFYLDADEAIQLQSDAVDLTGVKIVATSTYDQDVPKKIAVFSGNMASNVVNVGNEDKYAFDHIYEQMFPVQTWGSNYMGISTGHFQTSNAVSESDLDKDFFKIVAWEDNTSVDIEFVGGTSPSPTSISSISLDAGEFINVTKGQIYSPGVSSVSRNSSDIHILVEADRPVSVAQFIASQDQANSGSTDRKQDPAMAVLASLDQRISQTSLPIAPALETSGSWNTSTQQADRKEDYIILIKPHADNTTIEWYLNGDGTDYEINSGCWTQFGSSDFDYTIIHCAQTSCTSSCTQDFSARDLEPNSVEIMYDGTGGQGFLAYSYGFDVAEGYFAAAGANFSNRGVRGEETACILDDGSFQNPIELVAFGGSAASGNEAYTWALIDGPGSFESTYSITDILEDENEAEPEIKSTFTGFTQTGTYIFQCTIDKDEVGAGPIKYYVTVEIDYCCVAANPAEYKSANVEITDVNNIWSNKVFVDETVTVVTGTTLDVSNVDVVFGECGKLVIEDGAAIRANNSVFRACNTEIPWRGIVFEGDAGYSQILDCEFKNAIRAIEVNGEGSVQIAGNLFYNNYEAIRVENTTQANYTEAITGNTFIIDDKLSSTDPAEIFKVNCESITLDDNMHHGIVAVKTDFTQAISNNSFTSILSSSQTKEMKAILFNTSSGTVSQNEFNDVNKALSATSSSDDINFVDNEVIVSPSKADIEPQVDLHDCSQPVLVKGNEFQMLNTSLDGNSHFAIYADGCLAATVQMNSIHGFNAGIVFHECDNSFILDNTIKNALSYGIYVQGTPSKTNDEAIMVGCNEIDMDFGIKSNIAVGIGFKFISDDSKIFSNCISDCGISIYGDCESTTDRTNVPYIRGNFLYNYAGAGLYTKYYLCDFISTGVSRVGENTFFSNSGDAWDIHPKNVGVGSTFYVEPSFGLSTVSTKAHIFSGSDNKYSMASCAKQVYYKDGEEGHQELLDPDYNCDGDHSENVYLNFVDGENDLSTESVDPSSNSYGFILESPTRTNGVMIAFANSGFNDGLNALWEMSQTTSDFTEVEKAKLSYSYFVLTDNLNEAKRSCNELSPTSQDEMDWKSIYSLKLNLAINKRSVNSLTDDELLMLKEIIERKGQMSNQAVALYNLSLDNMEYDYIDMTSPTLDFEAPTATDKANMLQLFPNPAKSQVSVAFRIESGSEQPSLRVINAMGQEVQHVEVQFVTGSIDLDISQIESGVYFVFLESNGNEQMGMFVKQ